MENDILFEDIHGPIVFEDIHGPDAVKGSIFLSDPHHMNADAESFDTELNQSAIDTKADNHLDIEIDSCLINQDKKQGAPFPPFNIQMKPDPEYAGLIAEQSTSNQEVATKLLNDHYVEYVDADNQYDIEIAPCLVKKVKNKKKCSLFAPFSHQLKPDPEYACLVSEQYALNQEAATKLINDRYKWIMESAAMRKAKEQNIGEYSKRSTQYSKIIDSKEDVNTIQFSFAAVDDTEKTTHLLHNLHLTPDSLTQDYLEEANDNQHEMNHWHSGLNRFMKCHVGEVNTKANNSNFDLLKTGTQHHEHRVEDVLRLSRNDQKVGSKKCRKTNQLFCEGISSVCDDHLIDESKSQCE